MTTTTDPAATSQPEPPADAGIDELQADIERTRDRLGRTVDALAARLDVKSHARNTARKPAVQVFAAAALVAAGGVVAYALWRRR